MTEDTRETNKMMLRVRDTVCQLMSLSSEAERSARLEALRAVDLLVYGCVVADIAWVRANLHMSRASVRDNLGGGI